MGFVVDAVKAIGSIFGTILKAAGGILGGFLGVSKPKGTNSGVSTSRLNKQLVPEAYRKIIFGKTAAPLDLRYWEVYNTDYYDEVIALATHQIYSVKELYFENNLGFDASNNVQTNYNGVVTRSYKLGAPGQTALSVGSGTNWNTDSKMTGIAYILLKWHRDDKKLPEGPPNRYTQITEGALVYDPRRDSTQPGGSGTHRANDQSTWAYATLDSNGVPIGRNNALQALWYLLGWRIQNPSTGEWILVAGRGIDPNDINMATFITGANNCEVAGYYTDMVLSTEDDHTENEAKITADGLIGQLIDPGGLWSYYTNVDDTATVAIALTDDDVLETGRVSWSEYKPMADQYNQIVGKFVDPSTQALYQPRAYPMVRDATYESNLGVKRRKSIDFEQVQDGLLAQKLARLKLNEGQFQAEFTAMFSYRSLKAQAWSIVTYTSERFQWTKYFRVVKQGIMADGSGVSMTLREVHPSIWTAGSVASIPTLPIGYRFDSTTQVSVTGLARTNQTYTGSDGSIYDIANVTWSALPAYVRRVEVQYKQSTSSYWMPAGNVASDLLSAVLGPLFKSTSYDVRVRAVTAYEVAGPWATLTFTSGASGNLTASAIAAAAGTAVWSSITGTGKPADNADVTAVNAALGTNLIVNSEFTNGLTGWTVGWNGTTGLSVTRGLDLSGWSGTKHVAYATVSGTPAAGTVFDAYYSMGPGTSGLDIARKWAVPVVPGEKLYFSALVAGHRCNVLANLQFWDASGAYATETASTTAPMAGPNFANGDPTQATRVGAFVTVPANCFFAFLNIRAVCPGGQANPYIFFSDGFIAKVNTSQTVAPNYVMGPGDRLADVTANNTAAAIAGQGALATVNSADFATQVSGGTKPANNATRNVVTYSASAPVSPIDGDLWVDTSGTYAVFKLRVGGTWNTGANALSAYNALSGTPVALADINTTESSKLAGIQAGATVGASWTGNLTGRPTELTDGRVSSGLAATTGQVNTDKVVTSSIQANNVTNTVSAYTPGSVTCGSGSWTSVQSFSITGTGGLMEIEADGRLTADTGPTAGYSFQMVQFRLLRDGGVIYGPIDIPPNIVMDTGGFGVQTGYWTSALAHSGIMDNPGSGSHTYSLECFFPVGLNTRAATYRYLKATELKR